jgi:hypothetical protein
MPFSSAIISTVMLNFFAIVDKVSPLATVYYDGTEVVLASVDFFVLNPSCDGSYPNR